MKNWYCHCSKNGYCWNCYQQEYMTEDERIKLDLGTTITGSIQITRWQKKISQSQLAKLVGMKQSAISRFENSLGIPTLKETLKLAKALGLKINIRIDEKLPNNINTVAQNSRTEDFEVKIGE